MNSRISNAPQGEKLGNIKLEDQWNNIDWKKVENHVNRLQARIAKAVKEGIWHLVKRLQYLLTHSFYAKVLAIKKVNTNKGKRTAGIDGETWSSPESKMKAVLCLTDKKYVAKPLKRIFIEKPGKKTKRPLGIPTIYDRSMQALYALALEPIAEIKGDRTSFGFRKFRSPHDACEYAFHYLCTKNSPVWVLEDPCASASSAPSVFYLIIFLLTDDTCKGIQYFFFGGTMVQRTFHLHFHAFWT